MERVPESDGDGVMLEQSIQQAEERIVALLLPHVHLPNTVATVADMIREAMLPKWSRDVPMESGWYWWRANTITARKVVRVYEADKNFYAAELGWCDQIGGEWARIREPE